tara:strand:+ start:1982 stop:2419 length:438 start_codon:yes stop_codon:yes gene_type:complete
MTQPIDRLFERLSMTYGIAWDNSIGTAPLNEIKLFWLHELSAFMQSKESMMAISWALNHLPERPPNLVQFKNLCFQAPAVEKLQLPAPPADPARVSKELSKLADMRITNKKVDPKDWARKILGDYAAGAKKTITVVEMARNALES